MAGMEDFKGLSEGEQTTMKALLAESMARGAGSLGGAPVEAPAVEAIPSASDEAGLVLPIIEELDSHRSQPDLWS